MGLFGKIFGKEEKKESCCCEMEIVELPEGDIAAPCDCRDACDAPGAESITLTVLGPGCKRCHQLHENARLLLRRQTVRWASNTSQTQPR